jgi:hypothetical protein
VGLLVLVSGDIHSFAKARLPTLLATNGVMTLITAPARAGLLASDPMLEELDSLIGNVLRKSKAADAGVAVGGFSAGGIGAVRYAQFCLKQERKTHAPAAVFAVDSPLDYERWYHGAELYLQRLALAGRDLAEDRRATNEMRTALGGSPAEAADTYRTANTLRSLLVFLTAATRAC